MACKHTLLSLSSAHTSKSFPSGLLSSHFPPSLHLRLDAQTISLSLDFSDDEGKLPILSLFPLYLKFSLNFTSSSPVSTLYPYSCSSLIQRFFSVGYRPRYLLFSRLFSASQNKCNSVSTPEQNGSQQSTKMLFHLLYRHQYF